MQRGAPILRNFKMLWVENGTNRVTPNGVTITAEVTDSNWKRALPALSVGFAASSPKGRAKERCELKSVTNRETPRGVTIIAGLTGSN